ncbi:MAG: hypothetical protein HRU09_16290 [Oligoflexales bacterium]|nr:hypothetical protein [Oligoflexales bacterium]
MRKNLFQTYILVFLSFMGREQALMAQITGFPWCVAHRGYSAAHLENSMASIEAAVKAGADAIELDVRHSKDGRGLVLHDARLKRTATSKPAKTCKVKVPVSSQDYDSIKDNCMLKNGEEIPTLESVLDSFAGLDQALILEFKDFPSEATLKLLRELQGKPINLVGVSFEQKVLDTLSKQELIYQEPMQLIWLTPITVYLPDRFDGIGPYLISDGMIDHLKGNQKIIDMWTIDRTKKMKSLFSKGVHMITTNKVPTCLEVKKLF